MKTDSSGIYAISYINKYANIIKYRDILVEDFDLFYDYLEKGYHSKNNFFYVSNPEEIELALKEENVDMIYNIGTDRLKFTIRDTISNLNDTDFSKWMDIHYKTCEDKNIIGLSEHGLFIGRKEV